MEYVNVVMANWLPCTIRGLTTYYYDECGMPFYTIFINSKLSFEAQAETYSHEIGHINNNDFYRMVSIDDLEAYLHECA